MDVYVPVVDVENIDCIVRTSKGDYNEIQVKTRTKTEKSKGIFQVAMFKPRRNFFIICHVSNTDNFWVLPSNVFYANRVKTKYLDKLKLVRIIMGQGRKERLNAYYNAFYLLER